MNGVARAACLVAALTGSGSSFGADVRLTELLPTGVEVPATQAVRFRFDQPVAALGDMRREASEVPFRITPEPGCRWIWLDTRTLSCNLSAAQSLAPATRYRIRAMAGARIEDHRLAQVLDTTFETVRPRIRSAWLQRWLGPEQPLYRINADHPISARSLAERAYFADAGQQRSKVSLFTVPTGSEAAGADLAPAAPEMLARAYLLAPAAPLVPDTEYALVVGDGLRGAGPLASTEAQSVERLRTLPSPTLLGVRCLGIRDDRRRIVGANANTAHACDPQRGIAVVFSSPVGGEALGKAAVLSPAPAAPGGERSTAWARTSAPRAPFRGRHAKDSTYEVWMPFEWTPRTEYSLTFGEDLADLFGRPVEGAASIAFTTDHRRPGITLGRRDAVLEHGIDSAIPVWMTNVESATFEYGLRTVDGARRGRHVLVVPDVTDLRYGLPSGVRELLRGRSGLVHGQLTARSKLPGVPLRSSRPLQLLAQVSPFQLHFKLGHHDSLLWVTRFATGEPVAGARVSAYAKRESALQPGRPIGGVFTTDPNGLAQLPGTRELDPALKLIGSYRDSEPRLHVEVALGSDMAVLPIAGNYRLYRGAPYVNATRRDRLTRAFGVTAQGLYRPGETVRYKVFARAVVARRGGGDMLGAPPRGRYTLRVLDPLGNALLPAKGAYLSPFGTLSGDFALPADAKLGAYRVVLDTPAGESLAAFEVTVSDFQPAPFAVNVEFSAARARPGEDVGVLTEAALFAGGPYAQGPTRVVARVASGPLRAANPAYDGFGFDTRARDAEGKPSPRRDFQVLDVRARTDARGRLETVMQPNETRVPYGTLRVESAVQDDRGGRVAGRARIAFASRDRFVGLKRERWVERVGEPAHVDYLVVDAAGEVAAGAPVDLRIEREHVMASRVKTAGDVYQTRYVREWRPVHACEAVSAASPGRCTFEPHAAGSYRVRASVTDGAGRTHVGELSLYAVGAGAFLWADGDEAPIGLVPDKRSYAIGERARVLVRNPFPGANVLVTLERSGVHRSFVQRLESSTPLIEFDVTPDLAPGFHLSVLAMSPRTNAPLSDSGVDLGKPAQRIGYLRVPVDDTPNRLTMAIDTDLERYRPRDTVRIAFDVTGAGPHELAVAVLDEAVLALLPAGEKTFDPGAGLRRFGEPGIVNFSLLNQLVGRQKIERKGDAPAGDGAGAKASLRERLDSVAYWNPSVVTDAHGRASVEFELPDTLTGWRVLAMAVNQGAGAGLGSARFVSTRPTELQPVMPNQLTALDAVAAGFSVRNRSESRRTLDVSISARGEALDAPVDVSESVSLDAFEARSVFANVKPVRAGSVRFEARAGDAEDADALVHTLDVGPQGAPRAVSSAGTLAAGDDLQLDVALPPSAVAGSARGTFALSSSAVGDLAPAFGYFEHYPYACWEQRLTKGVAAAMYSGVDDGNAWPDAPRVLDGMLSSAAAFQANNGGMAFWRAEDRRTDAFLSAFTSLAFGFAEQAGAKVPAQVADRLDAYLESVLRIDRFAGFNDPSLAGSVRAVALHARALGGRLTRADLARYERALPAMTLFGKSQYLAAAERVPGTTALAARARDAVLAHGEASPGMLRFDDAGHRDLLGSAARSGCAVLDAVLARDGGGAATRDTATEILRGIESDRLAGGGRWDTTQENLWCLRAGTRFAARYESAPVALDMRLRAGSAPAVLAKLGLDERIELVMPELPGPGESLPLEVSVTGTGSTWYDARLDYRDGDLDAAFDSGFAVRREYSVRDGDAWRVLKANDIVSRGDLVRVDLYLDARSEQVHVALVDPVPGGFEPVNRQLATASEEATRAGLEDFPPDSIGAREPGYVTHQDYALSGFHFRELGHDSARFFAERLAGGRHHLAYVAQVIASGDFEASAPYAEAMYTPSTRGQGRGRRVTVQ